MFVPDHDWDDKILHVLLVLGGATLWAFCREFATAAADSAWQRIKSIFGRKA